jgi:hypothetical protein
MCVPLQFVKTVECENIGFDWMKIETAARNPRTGT